LTRTSVGLAAALIVCLAAGGAFVAGRWTAPHPAPAPGGSAKSAAPSQPPAVFIDPAAQRDAGLRFATVQHKSLMRRFEATGHIVAEPERSLMLRAVGAGRILSVSVAPGDPVHRGQVLIRYADNEAATLQSQIAASQGRLQEAEQQAQMEGAAVRRGRALLGQVVSAAELDRRRASLAGARDQAASLRQQIAALQATLRQHQPQPGHPGEAAIVSPVDGVVTQLSVAPGEAIDASRTLAAVADLSEVWLMMSVYQEDVGRLAKAGQVPFSVPGLPGQRTARLAPSSPLLQPGTGVQQVRCIAGNRDLALRPGMIVQASLPTTDRASGLAVPEAAVQRVDGQPTIFVRISPDRFRARKVRLGLQADGMAEVTDGLQEGDTVATDGSFWLKSQQLQAQIGSGD